MTSISHATCASMLFCMLVMAIATVASFASDNQKNDSKGASRSGRLVPNKLFQFQEENKVKEPVRNLQETTTSSAAELCNAYLAKEVFSEEPEDITNNQADDEEFECGDCKRNGGGDSISVLQCGYPACQYCNEDGSVCGRDTLQVTFASKAATNVPPNYQRFDYVRGRAEKVIIYYPNDGKCIVEVDGMECVSCAAVECQDGAAVNDFRLDCTNLNDMYEENNGDVAYECGVGHPLFQFLYDPRFLACQRVDSPSATFPPMGTTTNVDVDDPLNKQRGSSGSISGTCVAYRCISMVLTLTSTVIIPLLS